METPNGYVCCLIDEDGRVSVTWFPSTMTLREYMDSISTGENELHLLLAKLVRDPFKKFILLTNILEKDDKYTGLEREVFDLMDGEYYTLN